MAISKRSGPKAALSALQLLSVTLFALSAGALGGFGAYYLGRQLDKQGGSTNSQIVSSESELNAEIARNVSPSVVSIHVESVGSGFFGDFTQQGAGTGIIVSSDGYVVTNKHVIPENAASVGVTLSDGTVYEEVRVIGRDPRESVDVAFLKIPDVSGLRAAKLGDSAAVEVGEKVVAIGNALGEFQNTVTTGIISGLARPIVAGDGVSAEALTNLFQTDAAINAGNSGGPLVNVNSEVIGINTAVASGAENIGFAIPIDDIKPLVAGVLETGRLQVPFLGVRYIQLTDEIAEQYSLDVKMGAYLATGQEGPAVIPNSPAEEAGLKAEDIIVKINDAPIDENNHFLNVLSRFRVGDTVELTVRRDGKELTLRATLEDATARR